jgi:hypothetical protein
VATRYTSRVGARGNALYAALQAATFPVHPTTAERPVVQFADIPPTMNAETISIVQDAEQSSIEWKRSGPAGRDETIVFDVVIRCMTPLEADELDVWDRVTELSDVVQSIVYDTTTNRVVALTDDESEVYGGHVSANGQRVERWPDGWVGIGIVRFTFNARI